MGRFLHLQPGRANWGREIWLPPSPQVTLELHQDDDGLHFLNPTEEDAVVSWILYVPELMRSEPSITLRLNFWAQQFGNEIFDMYVYGIDEMTDTETGVYLPPFPFPVTIPPPPAGVGYYATYVDFDIQDSITPPINPSTSHLVIFLMRMWSEQPEIEDVIFFNGRTLPVFP